MATRAFLRRRFPEALLRRAAALAALLALAALPVRGQERLAQRENAPAGTAAYVPHLTPLEFNLAKLNRVIGVQVHDVALEEALAVMAAKADLRLSTAAWDVLAQKRVTLDLENVTLLDALHAAIRGTNLRFQVSPTGHLIVTARPERAAPAAPLALPGGTVTGRVMEAGTESPLPGAHVVVVGTTLGVAADRDGVFALPNLAPGRHRLRISYLGFQPEEADVVVEAAGTASVDVRLASRVLQSGGVVVQGWREGQVRALAQKRQAQNLTEVVSADAVGELPDRNVAEALQRVPGVAIQTDRGEGRFVSIRGVEPNLSNVTINGQNLASTAESRATALDLLPSEMLSSIEVVKAVTPDMDGEALGGTINVNTLSALDRHRPFFLGSVQGLRHQETVDYGDRKLPYQAHLTAGRRFGPGARWGVVVSGSASRRDYAVSQANPDHWEPRNGYFVPKHFENEVADAQRERYGLSANVDYQPTARTSLFLRTYYARTDELEDDAEYIFELAQGEATRQTPTAGHVDAGAGGLDLELTDLDESLYAVTLGGEQRFGAVTWSADATYTHGVLDRYTEKPEFTSGTRADFGFSYRLDGPLTTISFDDPSAVSDPANYTFGEIDVEYESNTEDTWSVSSDLRWDTRLAGRPGFLQAGAKVRTRTKTIDDLERGYDGGTLPATLALHPLAPPRGSALPVLGDTRALFDFFEAEADNPAYFVHDGGETRRAGVEHDADNDEAVYAAYAMGHVSLGALTVLAGLRLEATETESRRWQLLVDAATRAQEISAQTYTNRYVNVLPSVHLRYGPAEKLLVRASWTNTIGRPDYEELAGLRELDYLEVDPGVYRGSAREGNPALKPFEALNLDAAAEYYFALGGLFSVGGFYKRIDNPIYESAITRRDVDVEGRRFRRLDLYQDRNADAGAIRGLEASYQQLLLFLPAPFSGLGIAANVALMGSDVEVPGRAGEDLPLFGQSDLIYNVIPYFQRRDVELRLALSYQSAYLADVGEAAYQDVYADERLTVDLTAGLALRGDRLKLTAQVRNLTNEPERAYQGLRERYVQHVLTGRTFTLGLATSL